MALVLIIGSSLPAAAAPLLGPREPIRLVDDAGRSVTVPSLPRRIISLAPSVTELLFALGAGEQVVAVTQACNYPPEARSRPRLDFSGSAVERMVVLRPDLIVGMIGMVKPQTIQTLDRLGHPLLLLEAKGVGDVYRHLRWLGRLTGRLADADRVITHLEAQREELAARLRGAGPVSVFYLINAAPLITVGPNSFIHQLIEAAGGRNIAAQTAGSAYPQFSLEALIIDDPDVVLLAGDRFGPAGPDAPTMITRWPGLRAVAHQRVIMVDSDLMDRPGPRIYDAAWRLAEYLHPERFSAGAQP
ncbi:MAG: ABC transporter substrate-binding protein [Nitrospirota bacterium]